MTEPKRYVKAFAPASVANVSCGFDVLGFAMDKVGDTLEVEAISEPGVIIESISGPGQLSTDPDKNICGVVAKAMLTALSAENGVKLRLTKGILPGSGLGSSAASSVVTAFALNVLYGNRFTEKQLIEFAMIGEKLASGAAHADNVAPALMGGFTIVRSYEPLDIFKIPVPGELYCTVIHPKIEVRTELSRNILKKQVELKTAIKQWGNVAGLVAGLYSSNYELIGRSLTDYIIEPVRSRLIPGYYELTQYALLAGALGCGISGSGPSVFALCKGNETAKKVADAFTEKAVLLGLPFEVHVSKISVQGARILNEL